MKKTITLISFLALLAACNFTYGQPWVNVGSSCFSGGETNNPSIAIDHSGTPYVYYRDYSVSGGSTVMKYNGSSWVTVGSAGEIPGNSEYNNHSIAIDAGGTPYVVFDDWNINGHVSVMKFNGSHWVNVGAPGFAGWENRLSIAIDGSGKPYVVGEDDATSNINLSVMKFDGSSWVTVGSPGFSAGRSDYETIAIDGSGTPYVAYEDGGIGGPATVMKYNGSNWVIVGSAGFSVGEAAFETIAIDGSGTPYVAYKDVASGRATVKKYNGSSWVNVGSPGFSAGGVESPSLAIDGSGTPYVAYGDDNLSSGNATVMKYNGSVWVNVGSAGFSASNAAFTSLAIAGNGTPYVVYGDNNCSANWQATVMKPGPWVGIKNTASPVVASLSVFPNPNSGTFTISLYSGTDENAHIIITNMLGEKIKECAITTNKETEMQLNVPPGIYFISAVTNSESVSAKIIVE